MGGAWLEEKRGNGEVKQGGVCAENSKLGGSTVFHIPKYLPGRALKRFQVTFIHVVNGFLSYFSQ